jgi:hypothetical protein
MLVLINVVNLYVIALKKFVLQFRNFVVAKVKV